MNGSCMYSTSKLDLVKVGGGELRGEYRSVKLRDAEEQKLAGRIVFMSR